MSHDPLDKHKSIDPAAWPPMLNVTFCYWSCSWLTRVGPPIWTPVGVVSLTVRMAPGWGAGT